MEDNGHKVLRNVTKCNLKGTRGAAPGCKVRLILSLFHSAVRELILCQMFEYYKNNSLIVFDKLITYMMIGHTVPGTLKWCIKCRSKWPNLGRMLTDFPRYISIQSYMIRGHVISGIKSDPKLIQVIQPWNMDQVTSIFLVHACRTLMNLHTMNNCCLVFWFLRNSCRCRHGPRGYSKCPPLLHRGLIKNKFNIIYMFVSLQILFEDQDYRKQSYIHIIIFLGVLLYSILINLSLYISKHFLLNVTNT